MRQVDIHKLADEARFNPFHRLVLLWCALFSVFTAAAVPAEDKADSAPIKHLFGEGRGFMALPLQQNFIAIAIPAVIGMVAVLLIDHGRSASAHHDDLSVELPQSPAGTSAAGVRH
jgi:hypothetical protein